MGTNRSFDRGIDLRSQNTPELKWERYKALLAIEFPEEYAKRFPRTDPELAAVKAAAEAFKNPISVREYLRRPRPPEEQKALEQALEPILNQIAGDKR